MTKKKISALPAGGAMSGADLLAAVQSGVTNKVTGTLIRTLVGNDGAGTQLIGRGGTGATTAQGARNNLLPVQTGNAGKVLQTDGTNVSWQTASGGVDTVASPGATLTVSIVGTTLNADIDLTHANTWSGVQTFNKLIAGVTTEVQIPQASGGFALYARNDPAGTGSFVQLAGVTYSGVFTSPNGTTVVYLGTNSVGLEVTGAVAKLMAGAEIQTAVGFFGTPPQSQQPGPASLTDSTTGANQTGLSQVMGTGADMTINDNFATVYNRLTAIRAALLAYGFVS